jgi:hypothetical protein
MHDGVFSLELDNNQIQVHCFDILLLCQIKSIAHRFIQGTAERGDATGTSLKLTIFTEEVIRSMRVDCYSLQ